MKAKAVFDSNIIIDFFNRSPQAAEIFEKYEIYISGLTMTEVLTGAKSAAEEAIILNFLNSLNVIHTNNKICEMASSLRREYRLKLPDAIIYATAKQLGYIFFTRNSKDFSEKWLDVKIPYGSNMI